MTPNYPTAILQNFGNDYRAAYEYLSKAYLALERQHCAEGSSRFLEISQFESDSDICLRQITEYQLSRTVGMADCKPEFFLRKWLYLDDSGELQPVTIAASTIIAGEKCVGEVLYTDH